MGWWQKDYGYLGEPPQWDDLRFPASASNPAGGGTSKASVQAERSSLLFGGTENEFASFLVQMPHAWMPGTGIRPHLHWVQSETGGVVWTLDYMILEAGQTYPTYPDYTRITAVQNPGVFPYVSGNLMQITSFPEIPMDGLPASTMLICILGRQGQDPADTMSNQAELLEFDIHYRVGRRGSIEEFPEAPV